MTEQPDVPVVICGVCDRSLNRWHTSGGIVYIHGPADADDHDVVPVDAPPHWRGRCDFCTTTTAEFILPARDFVMPTTPGGGSLGNWAACPMCARFIESNQWNLVLRRAMTAHEQLHGVQATEQQTRTIRALHRAIRANVCGAIRPIPSAPPQMTPEQARVVVYQRLYGHDLQPPPYTEPGTALGAQRLDRDCLRLATVEPDEFAADPEAVATALEIAEQLRWDS